MSEPIYDETDRRLMAALHAVDVPAGLQSRLEQKLQEAAQKEALLEAPCSPHAPQAVQSVRSPRSPWWNRRRALAAVVAAGLGGMALGYRQFTQPLSQSWLSESSQSLLAQLDRAQWRPLAEEEARSLAQSLQAVGFLSQVRNIKLRGTCDLQPPRNVQSATAYDLDNDLILLDLIIDRGVQGVSRPLSQLPWTRSDIMAMAMADGNRTLVFSGPASLQSHILPHPTT